MATNFGDLAAAENGLVSRRIFIEPEIYARELERIEEAVKKTVILSSSTNSQPVFRPASSGIQV